MNSNLRSNRTRLRDRNSKGPIQDGHGSIRQTIVTEAGCQLAAAAATVSKSLENLPAEPRFRGIVESLFNELSADDGSIAKLVGSLLADLGPETAGWVGLGLERYFLLLQVEIRKLLGPQAAFEVVRLHALSAISQCVFYGLASEKLCRIFPHLQEPLPAQKIIGRHIGSSSLAALRQEVE